jgi:hypothetical protein
MELILRTGSAPGPPPSRLSAASPVTVSVSTVVVRSGTAILRTVAFCRPNANASIAINHARPLPDPVGSAQLAPAAAASRMAPCAANTIGAHNRARPDQIRPAAPPVNAPAMNPANATAAISAERPDAGSAAKPKNTTLPVIFATNTWPSPRYDAASMNPVATVSSSNATTVGENFAGDSLVEFLCANMAVWPHDAVLRSLSGTSDQGARYVGRDTRPRRLYPGRCAAGPTATRRPRRYRRLAVRQPACRAAGSGPRRDCPRR